MKDNADNIFKFVIHVISFKLTKHTIKNPHFAKMDLGLSFVPRPFSTYLFRKFKKSTTITATSLKKIFNGRDWLCTCVIILGKFLDPSSVKQQLRFLRFLKNVNHYRYASISN